MAMAEREGQGVSSGASFTTVVKAVSRDAMEISEAQRGRNKVRSKSNKTNVLRRINQVL